MKKMSALKSYKKWVFVMQQVCEAKYFIEKAEELGHPYLFTGLVPFHDFLAYFRSAVNSYAKCFVSAGPGRSKIEKSKAFSDRLDLLEKHNLIMELRNRYVSHNDVNEIESAEIEEHETEEEIALRLIYNISFPFDRLYETRELINFLEVYIVDRMQHHAKAIERETGKNVGLIEGNQE